MDDVMNEDSMDDGIALALCTSPALSGGAMGGISVFWGGVGAVGGAPSPYGAGGGGTSPS